MNILVINHYVGSPEHGMEFRPYYMAREWMKSGNKVLNIGGTYSHLRRKQPEREGREIVKGVYYSWVKVNRYNGNGVGRIISMFLFIGKLMCNYKKYLGGFKPDVVVASSTYPLDIYPARKIAKRHNAKLVYEVHDLWPLSPMELGGYSASHPFIKVMQTAEDYCYRHVNGVISILSKAEGHMRERGLAEGKFHCVPNGIVLEDWKSPTAIPDEHKRLLKRLHDEGKFVVGYAGAHGPANSLDSVIDAAAEIKDNNVELVLTGTGQDKKKLMKHTQEKGYKNVHFLPPINKMAIPTLLGEMDALYVGLQKQSLFRYGISPNKMYDYMMAGKPIIQAIDAGNNIVEEAKCGIYAEPENAKSIGNAILKIKEMSREERETLGKNGHEFVLKNHTYQVLAEKFLDALKNMK